MHVVISVDIFLLIGWFVIYELNKSACSRLMSRSSCVISVSLSLTMLTSLLMEFLVKDCRGNMCWRVLASLHSLEKRFVFKFVEKSYDCKGALMVLLNNTVFVFVLNTYTCIFFCMCCCIMIIIIFNYGILQCCVDSQWLFCFSWSIGRIMVFAIQPLWLDSIVSMSPVDVHNVALKPGMGI